MLPEIGVEGQVKLKNSSVLVVGAGGLGSPVLLYLAAAGVGKIGIVDGDTVSLTNLQRQVIHSNSTCGELKVVSARGRLRELNPEIMVVPFPEYLSNENADRIIRNFNVVVDCTDNLETRFLANEMCVRNSIPLVYGAVFRYEGQVSVFHASMGPCFRCMYPIMPDHRSIPDPADNGLLGTIPGVIGLIQANEVIKLLLGIGESLIGSLVLFDGYSTTFKTIHIKKLLNCPVCGTE